MRPRPGAGRRGAVTRAVSDTYARRRGRGRGIRFSYQGQQLLCNAVVVFPLIRISVVSRYGICRAGWS
jgi:hypothetical protein